MCIQTVLSGMLTRSLKLIQEALSLLCFRFNNFTKITKMQATHTLSADSQDS